jgi:hypothetical protein
MIYRRDRHTRQVAHASDRLQNMSSSFCVIEVSLINEQMYPRYLTCPQRRVFVRTCDFQSRFSFYVLAGKSGWATISGGERHQCSFPGLI